MSVTSKVKIGGLRTGEFAVDVALNVGIIGCQGVRLTGTGIRKVGECLEVAGLVGESAMQARREQLHRGTDELIRQIQALEQEADGKTANNANGDPEVVLV